MPKRTIDSFFRVLPSAGPAKRSNPSGQDAPQLAGGEPATLLVAAIVIPGTTTQQQQEQPPGVPSSIRDLAAVQALVETQAPGSDPTAGPSTSPAEQRATGESAAPAPASASAPHAVGTAEHAEALRLHGLNNLALALAVVQQAAARPGGGVPSLPELLVEQSWSTALQPEFRKQYFTTLQRFVAEQRLVAKIYPAIDNTFRAFNSCPLDKVRVVVLGQDPYHGAGQAMGLCFSVPPGVQVPSSLRNMFKELQTDVGCKPPGHGDLTSWTLQGVLLLNTVLTVRDQQAASHASKGWENLTDAAIQTLSKQRRGLVFLLWGNHAQKKAKLIDGGKHHVLTAAHPSGLSASRGFFGCKHFSKANQLLVQAGQPPINWQIDPVV